MFEVKFSPLNFNTKSERGLVHMLGITITCFSDPWDQTYRLSYKNCRQRKKTVRICFDSELEKD